MPFLTMTLEVVEAAAGSACCSGEIKARGDGAAEVLNSDVHLPFSNGGPAT